MVGGVRKKMDRWPLGADYWGEERCVTEASICFYYTLYYQLYLCFRVGREASQAPLRES